MYRTIVFSILFLLTATTAFAQAIQLVSTAHFQHTIKSQAVGEDRTILVKVPANYERSQTRYPVIYMLDAHPPQNAMMAGIVEQQTWGDVMSDAIIVGIQNTNRTRDMTPTPGERADGGGAEKFLRFIETEVVPYVDKNYRTQPYRTIAGHSLGGMFVIYALLERPDVFNGYIAASPHMQWDNNYLVKRVEESLKRRPEWNKTLFVGLGDEPAYMESYNALQQLLKQSKPKNLEYEFRLFKEENHGSVVLPAYYAGLRKIYAGWSAPGGGSVADIENHYRSLSKRFGYTIKVPEAFMNRVGYQLLGAGKNAEAIAVFEKNVESYPASANVYDSLGEGYERSGDKTRARANYEKAWKMAEQNGEAQLAAVAKANFERVAAGNK
jgi:predicted alpha/beta superfamily hydrolase